MKIILTRDTEPSYVEIPAPDASFGAPGTVNQTYLHAKHLAELGHEVYVLGMLQKEQTQDNVVYIGKKSINGFRDFIFNTKPEIIITEGGAFLYNVFGKSLNREAKDALRNTSILHVMHNGPAWKRQASLNYIDYWCYVGESQKRLIKIGPCLDLFNATFLRTVHSKTPIKKRKQQIVVVSAPIKIGIQEASEALKRLKKEFDFKVFFLMPVWFQDRHKFNEIASQFSDINVVNFSQFGLSKLFKESLAVVATFHHGEQCPVTILDAYATGTLCITGNHSSLRRLNPMGIQCRIQEQYNVFKWILENPRKAIDLGHKGLKYLKNSDYTESAQKKQLRAIVNFIKENPKASILEKKYWRYRYYCQLKYNAFKYYYKNLCL
ncbi:hypothetical protein CL633_01630 [bacterium]|nr:hypothetical protein [bacterium]|tara:strand:+ start:4485 stop:5621 length:1137 start_codon:yes stop_codon:yes gene_type:complete